MTFKVGDEVKENNEWLLKHLYGNGYNDRPQLIPLGRARHIVSHVDKDHVTVYAAWWDNAGYEKQQKDYRTVPAAQLLPFPRKPELEEEYRQTVARIGPQITECLRMAESAIEDAIRLSEEHGIPFEGPSGLMQQYTPMKHKLPDIEGAMIEEITGLSTEGLSGWEQSALC